MASDTSEFASAVAALFRETSALYAAIARRFDLTSQQTQLLCTLSREQPSFGELAAMLGCDKTNVTGMVDRLERKGFLTREKDAKDRRVSRVVLTEQGWALREKIRAEFGQGLSGRFAGLSTKDQAELVRLLRAAGSTGR